MADMRQETFMVNLLHPSIPLIMAVKDTEDASKEPKCQLEDAPYWQAK
jgi:hypothetical protein